MAKRKTFDHLKKDLFLLEKWPNKKHGESYARTKARMKQIPALMAALSQKPMGFWGLSERDVLEAFVPSPENKTMFSTNFLTLKKLIQDGVVSEKNGIRILKTYGSHRDKMLSLSQGETYFFDEEVRREAVRMINLARDAFRMVSEENVNPDNINYTHWLGEAALIRRAVPDVLSDEGTRELLGGDAAIAALASHVDSWQVGTVGMARRIALARTLPEWKSLVACARVHAILSVRWVESD